MQCDGRNFLEIENSCSCNPSDVHFISLRWIYTVSACIRVLYQLKEGVGSLDGVEEAICELEDEPSLNAGMSKFGYV